MCITCSKVSKALTKKMNITLFDYQRDIIENTHSTNMVLLGGRQIGKTMILALKVLSHALVHANTTTLIVSPSLRQSLHIMRYVHEYISKLNLGVYTSTMSKSEVEFINKSRILSLPSSPSTIRGYTCHVVVVDEANFIDEQLIEEVLMPTLSTTRGYMWLISTPNIKDHIFYRLYINPPQGWLVYTIPSYMNPLISKEFLETQRELLGILYEQEYECKYVEDEQGLIPSTMIDEIIHDKTSEIIGANTNTNTNTKRIVLVDIGGKSSYMGVIIAYKQHDGNLYVQENREYKGEYLKIIDDLVDEFHDSRWVLDISGLGGSIQEYIQRLVQDKVHGIAWSKENKYRAFISMMRAIQDQRLYIDKDAKRIIEQLKRVIIKNGHITTKDGYDDLLYALMLYYAYEEQEQEQNIFLPMNMY